MKNDDALLDILVIIMLILTLCCATLALMSCKLVGVC